MRIVFNTRQPHAPSSIFHSNALRSLNIIDFDDWENYKHYDVALFMSYAEDLHDMLIAKQIAPKLKVGAIGIRGSVNDKFLNAIDFFVATSIEHEDFLSKYQKPIIKYYENPCLKKIKKRHARKTPIIIGYHGNKVHLESMYPIITNALNLLSNKYSIEFWAMYNIDKLGKWNVGIPDNVKINHIQWSEENYYKYLSLVDIGIAPNLMPIKSLKKLKRKAVIARKQFLDSDKDYLIRFKMCPSTNRISVFSSLCIPIVADMYPTSCQLIRDGYSGFLVYSSAGWYNALERLVVDNDLRQNFADNMQNSIGEIVDHENQNKRFIKFLEEMIRNTKPILSPQTIEDPSYDLSKNLHFWSEYIKRFYLKAIIDIIRSIKRGHFHC